MFSLRLFALPHISKSNQGLGTTFCYHLSLVQFSSNTTQLMQCLMHHMRKHITSGSSIIGVAKFDHEDKVVYLDVCSLKVEGINFFILK